LRAAVDYPAIAFGGRAFLRTPLGKATREAIARGLDQLLGAVPVETWEARVADVRGNLVVVNGGENVGLQPESEFIVREKGHDVTDPTTGDVIDVIPGPVLGRIKVYEIRPAAAYAKVLEGRVRRGDYLEPKPDPLLSPGTDAEIR